MSDPGSFEQRFGAAMASVGPIADGALGRAIAVHRNTSFKAAADALADNFPVLRALVGDDAFAACARAFVQAQPPCDPRLCLYGAGFANFLGGYEPFSAAPWLADVGALEWFCVEALFAADARALDGGSIAARLDPDRPISLHPSVRFACFASPAASIWLAHQSGAAAGALAQITWSAQAVLVARPEQSLFVTPIDPAAFAFLDACAAGASVGRAAAAVAAANADVAIVFSTLINAGAFA